MKIVKPSATLLAYTSEPITLLETCGRICYKSEDQMTSESGRKFLEMIKKRHHESVVEHAGATIHFVCDRGVSHEIVRHRLASYSQESTRYCNYSKAKFGNEISVIEPPGLDSVTQLLWNNAMTVAEITYLRMLEGGCQPQIARSVLPTCLKTELAMTTNFREWAHFLTLRLAPAAHPQMREVASMARAILIGIAPDMFKEFANEGV
jgi:thymidylate synthase (FAD)